MDITEHVPFLLCLGFPTYIADYLSPLAENTMFKTCHVNDDICTRIVTIYTSVTQILYNVQCIHFIL